MENGEVVLNLPVINFDPVLDSAFRAISDLYPALGAFLKNFFGYVTGISIVAVVIFLIGIIYAVERLKQIRRKEEEIYDTKVEPAYDATAVNDPALASRWDNVVKHIESENENDWKQAIIEADIILDEILNKLGYKGESIGEKLRRVEPADMKSLNDAWEAHKVRNAIAHDGSGFTISHHEARRIMNLYKKVFQEFYYV
jgi:hypothetical protein